MIIKPSKFTLKIIDFLLSKYKGIQTNSSQKIIETKRLSKSRKDIIERIQRDIDALYNLSEIIRISNITSDEIGEGDTAYPKSESSNTPTDEKNKIEDHPYSKREYTREIYTTLDKEIIIRTLELDLIGEPNNVEILKNIQRDIMFNIFDKKYTNKLLDSIFMFHPNGILSQEIGDFASYKNSNDMFEPRYQIKHKKAYHDLAYLLIKRGMNEIIKNLHPKDDEILINNFKLTLNIIRRLTYEVDKIDNYR